MSICVKAQSNIFLLKNRTGQKLLHAIVGPSWRCEAFVCWSTWQKWLLIQSDYDESRFDTAAALCMVEQTCIAERDEAVLSEWISHGHTASQRSFETVAASQLASATDLFSPIQMFCCDASARTANKLDERYLSRERRLSDP